VKLCVYESMSDYAANSELRGWISGTEIQDNTAPVEEIRSLRDENSSLSAEVSRLKLVVEQNKKSGTNEVNDFKELIEVLSAIELTVPPELRDREDDPKMDLLTFVIASRDVLVRGVTNRAGIDNGTRFIYHNVMPKLQVHDLAINEKVAGVHYRRSALSKKGLELLAFVDRVSVTSKKGEEPAKTK
jgi:hypothetical protein